MVTISHPSAFGELLRRYRQAAALTQEELAARARLSARGISNLERGVRRLPQRGTVELLADALSLSAGERAAFHAAARRRAAAGSVPISLPGRLSVGAHSLPPFVGRAAELDLLDGHLAAAGPPLLLLAGEPGIGKTRLLREAAPRAGRAGWTVLWGGCQRRGGQEPYAPLLDAVDRYLRMAAPARVRAVLRGCAWLVRLLPELAAGPIEPLPAWTLSPEQERRLMFAAVSRFLANVAGPAGTLLLLDDLQWAGQDALDLLASLVRLGTEDIASPRVVGAYRDTDVRPEDRFAVTLADLAQGGLAARCSLGPLSPTDVARLLDHLLEREGPEQQHGAALREQVLRRAGGVPFYVVSCAQGLRSQALEASADGVPWDVAQGIRQRVTALPDGAQEVLEVAAIAGREVPHALLTAVLARPVAEVLAGLEAACRARLLEEAGAYAYRFTHDVIREVVEADVGAARRVVLHRQIADALVGRPGEPLVEAVAYHYARTEEHGEAAAWLERAGDRAAAGYANAAALAHYTAAWPRARAGGAEVTVLSRLDEKLGDVHLLLGEYVLAQQALARAGEMLREDDVARRAALRRKEGLTWMRQGEYALALATFTAAEEDSGAESGEIPAKVRASIDVSRGTVHLRRGEYAAADAAASQAIMLLSTEGSDRDVESTMARAVTLQGHVAHDQGDLARAEDCYLRSMAIDEHIGDQPGIASAWNNLGLNALHQGDLARAEEGHRRSLVIKERMGDQQGISSSWTNLGEVLRARGDLAQAEACCRQSLAIDERIGDGQGIAICLDNLGEVLRDRGDLIGAENCQQRSIAIKARIGDQMGLVMSWCNLGHVATERGDLAAAAAWCRRARRLAHRLGVPAWEAAATLGQARARLGIGRVRAAAALLARGRALAVTHHLPEHIVRAALLAADVELRQTRAPQAQAAAEEALRLATREGRRREEALARRLLGQCALASGDPATAISHLRAALALLVEMGAVLEAARTRLALATALASAVDGVPVEAQRLLVEARAGFAASSASGDLAQAEQMIVDWRIF